MQYRPNKPLNDDDRKVIENDVQHINTMKINIARRNRNIAAVTALGWFGLAALAIAWDIRWIAFVFAVFALINAFRMNNQWKILIELYEDNDE